MVGLPACSSMRIACIITMPDQICPVSCRPHFSSDTWPASAMVSSSCSEWLGSALHCSLFDIYTGRSNVSNVVASSSSYYFVNFIRFKASKPSIDIGSGCLGLGTFLGYIKRFIHLVDICNYATDLCWIGNPMVALLSLFRKSCPLYINQCSTCYTCSSFILFLCFYASLVLNLWSVSSVRLCQPLCNLSSFTVFLLYLLLSHEYKWSRWFLKT